MMKQNIQCDDSSYFTVTKQGVSRERSLGLKELILLLDVKEQFVCKVEKVLSPLTEKQDNESDDTQKSLTPWNRF